MDDFEKLDNTDEIIPPMSDDEVEPATLAEISAALQASEEPTTAPQSGEQIPTYPPVQTLEQASISPNEQYVVQPQAQQYYYPQQQQQIAQQQNAAYYAAQQQQQYRAAMQNSPYGMPTNVRVNNVPQVAITQVEKNKSEPVQNKGLQLFALLLAVFLIIATALGAGYLMGNRNTFGALNTDFAGSDLAQRPGGDAPEGTPGHVYNNVTKSVVLIQVYSTDDKSKSGEASGIVYSEDGYIVTNDHIYAEIANPKFLVTFSDGKSYEATYVAGDQRSDLAVLKIEADGLTPAVLGNSEEAQVGESVVAIGNPGGSTFTFSISEGIISAINRWANNASSYSMKFIQIDAAINSGNSGGALANMFGQVIGITSWKYANFENVAFAIPSTTVKRVCDSLIKNGFVAERAKIGINYKAVDKITAELNDISTTGIMVMEISPDAPVSKTELKTGDIITKIDGEDVNNASVILQYLEDHKPGDVVKFTVVNESGNTIEVSAELIEDKGTSSHNKNSTDAPDTTSGGEFNFPEGE